MAPLDWMDVAGGLAPAAPEAGAELLDGLNPPQREAATHPGGPLLILAGAGSGKTRVITRRIAWLVHTGRAQSEQILAITFTNKAAREMAERVAGLLGPSGPWIGTFHSVCARILRREIGALGNYSGDFSIYDTADRNQLLKRLIRDLGYDTARFRPSVVGAWISKHKNTAGSQPRAEEHGAGAEGWGKDAPSEAMEHEVLRLVRDAYDAALVRANALDFDDLLLKTLELFRRHPGVRDAYAYRFRHVLVDEYQDTNRVQYELVRHLCSIHGNLDVCGDPDQSIYAWRGADIQNILDFERDFPGAKVVKLEQNYRSSGAIVRAAQAVIAHNQRRRERALWTEREQGAAIRVLECSDEDDEAEAMVREVRALLQAGHRLDQMAVLYRANFLQRALERALRLGGFAYQIAGGVEFYQRREIKDLLAYLKVLHNPADNEALRRIVNVPPRGIGERSLELLEAHAQAAGQSLAQTFRDPRALSGLRGKARSSTEALGGLLERLSHATSLSAAEALDQVLEAIDYAGYLANSDDPEAETRAENVEELRANAASYDRQQPEGRLAGFLSDVALVSDVDSLSREAGQNTGAITLMTLHAAKGLEYPIVFLVGLEDGLFPHNRALDEGGDSGLEEERRLMYVGLTRAMDRLYLSWAERRMHFGETHWSEPSRFLKELPDEVLEPTDEGDEESVLGSFEPAPAQVALSEGDLVRHGHFGTGRIERLVGAGANARATVLFQSHGPKVLLLAYANLQRLGRARP